MAKILAASLVREAIPNFNPVIAAGIPTAHFKELEAYVHAIFADNNTHLPEGLRYLGYRRAAPEEERAFVLEKKANGKSKYWTVELAESSIYLMIYMFEYNGVKIDHGIYLPYLVKGSQMWVRGSLNTILPVLTAPVFSVESKKQQIFMKLLVSKISFNRINYSILCDDRELALGVVHARIYRGNPKDQANYEEKKDETVAMQHATALYIFCEYGVKEAFRRYAGCEVYLGEDKVDLPENIAQDASYSVFRSRQRKPTSVKRMKTYEPHDIRIAAPTEMLNNSMFMSLIGAFFYIADSYSLYFTNAHEIDDVEFWRVILGKVCLRTNDSVSALLAESERHLENIRRMLDVPQKLDLERAGIEVDNMVDLLAYVNGHFTEILRREEPGSLYGKRMLVLRNVLERLIRSANMIVLKGGSNKNINERSIRQDISKYLLPDAILSLQNLNCRATVMAATDCMMFNHTCKFLLQNNISNNKKRKKGTGIDTNDPDKHIHPSVMEIGSYQVIKDSEQTGRQVINPYAHLSASGVTKQNPELAAKIDYLSRYLIRE